MQDHSRPTVILRNFEASDNGGAGIYVDGGKVIGDNVRTRGNKGGGIVAKGDAEIELGGDSDIR